MRRRSGPGDFMGESYLSVWGQEGQEGQEEQEEEE
jgi:hypothetical protein